jgi:tRNA (guanine-N7-)-methyltransferase
MLVLNEQSNSGDKTRRGAFFGRRKGHPLRAHQTALMANLLPRLALDLTQPAPAHLGALFADPIDSVRLEIGFGGGEHLAAQALANPGIGFLGCEPFVNGMAKMLAAVEDKHIRNIRLHFGDATELLDWLPDGSLIRVDILYPDPWPKRRHWKRRIIQHQSIAAFARALATGGTVNFATDIADYAAWTLERFLRAPTFAWTTERAAEWRAPWEGHVATRYEAKAKRDGRTPTYFVFRRTPEAV